METRLSSEGEPPQPGSKLRQAWRGTRQDFFHSWRLLRENYKAFLGTELFAILAFALSLGLILVIFYILALFCARNSVAIIRTPLFRL